MTMQTPIPTQKSFFDMVTQEDGNKTPDNAPTESIPPGVEQTDDHPFHPDDLSLNQNPDIETGSSSHESSKIPHEARRVLVQLLRQGVIIAQQNPKMFELLSRYEGFVRRHLSEVYLQLILDLRSGVAFVANLTHEFSSEDNQGDDIEPENEFAALIPKRTLSLYDTLVLLVLRKHYQERETAGEQKITIDLERLESYLTPFLPLTDHGSLDRKKLIARVKEMIRRKLLASIRGTEERYEITPIIRYVVNVEFLESMLDVYTQLASEPILVENDEKVYEESLP